MSTDLPPLPELPEPAVAFTAPGLHDHYYTASQVHEIQRTAWDAGRAFPCAAVTDATDWTPHVEGGTCSCVKCMPMASTMVAQSTYPSDVSKSSDEIDTSIHPLADRR